MRLWGRAGESAALRELAEGLRSGLGAALVLRGGPGAGKTALLDEAASKLGTAAAPKLGTAAAPNLGTAAAPKLGTAAPASGVRVLRVDGVEAERRFPFAALHRLLIPLLAGSDGVMAGLRRDHQDALYAACGLSDGPPAGARATGLATAALLARVAPVLCLIDDADRADRESLEALAACEAAGVGLVFAIRGEPGPVAGLPLIDIAGLTENDGLELLRSAVDGPIDRQIAARLVAATSGNPLALLELSRELTAGQLTGAHSLPDPLPLGGRLAEPHLARARTLPESAQTWLLLAAAEPCGDLPYITAAARRLGLAPRPPETARDFHKPSARAAVYHGATGVQRRAAHAALAAVITRPDDADLRAWHLAAASVGPDDEIAAELARTADRAGRRGGHAARVTFLIRAAEMSRNAAERQKHLLTAAETALAAGAPRQALRLAADASPNAIHDARPNAIHDARHNQLTLSEATPATIADGRALIVRANALVMIGSENAYAQGPDLCLRAARAFGEKAPLLAREALSEAVDHFVRAGHLAPAGTAADIAQAIKNTMPESRNHELLAAFELLVAEGNEQALPAIRRAATSPLATGMSVSVLSTLLWDAGLKRRLWRRAIDTARETGEQRQLVVALYCLATVEAELGQTRAATELLAEADIVRGELGGTAELRRLHQHPGLAAWRGTTGADFAEELAAAHRLGAGSIVSVIRRGIVLLALGRGDYAQASTVARDVFDTDELGLHPQVLPDLVEAAVRGGDRVLAGRAFAVFAPLARAAGTDWARGLLARTQAVLASADRAEPLYREAVALLDGLPARADLARAHLLHGEWLRRQRRRRDARAALTIAREMFEVMEAAGFASRAAQELEATGATVVRNRPAGLTAQELAIARLAAAGATNGEIAAQLYLSANTVDYHLRKVFRKLDVTSRRQLEPALRREVA
ncbi:LuxR C-terminal-related transcriptional regulator [Actinoplanes sp. CA-015351]|uniref:helix-turn-helix transcriptional regulator n=1 Tax=Actinoplanes sp. CA-015351 TaxID=3239897 RepID=UPI003D990E81